MKLSNHTRIMNYLIGLCKKTGNWPSTLSDLGYDVQLIEKSIRTSSLQKIKPDIIAVSNKHLHSIVFDCKGGTNVEPDQLERYAGLSNIDFVNWIDMYSRDKSTFDVCFSDLLENHSEIMQKVDEFLVITFGEDEITKENSFSKTELENAFNSSISLSGMLPPLNYYPFSNSDDKCVIIPHLLRALLSIATEKGRDGPDVLETVLETEAVLRKVHKMWECLSVEHRNELKGTLERILSHLRSKYSDTFASQLEKIQTKRGGYGLHSTLEAFRNTCKNIIDECEKQPLLTDYLSPARNQAASRSYS